MRRMLDPIAFPCPSCHPCHPHRAGSSLEFDSVEVQDAILEKLLHSEEQESTKCNRISTRNENKRGNLCHQSTQDLVMRGN
jgi:hypothetical protein